MGQTLSASAMIDQLLYRCPFVLSRPNALFFINRAVRFWDGQASYSFNCKYSATAFSFAPAATTATAPSDMDMGQDFYLVSTVTIPYPVPRKMLTGYGVGGVQPANKTNVNQPDHYVIAGRTIVIYPPPSSAITLGCFYHIITIPVTDSVTSYTLFPDNFDDIIMDWAEAEIKRVFRKIGWTEIYGRVMDQGKMLVDQYRTDTALNAGQAEAIRQANDTKIKQAS